MVSALESLPPETSAGKAFDYSVWGADSIITLCNVPFDNTYRDIVDWDAYGKTPKQYIDSMQSKIKLVLNAATYLAYGRPIRIPTPFSVAVNYNYLMVQNGSGPIDGGQPTTFFYFINDVDYVAPNTTHLSLQLDVWSTYYNRVEFGKAYVERGHLGIAALDAFKDYGQRYLSQPEGLDVGAEYAIPLTYGQVLAETNTFNYDIIVTSTVNLLGGGSITNPSIDMASGSLAEGLPNAVDVLLFDVENYLKMLKHLKDKPWVAQGIGSVSVIPKGLIDASRFPSAGVNGITYKNLRTPTTDDKVSNKKDIIIRSTNWRDEVMVKLPYKFQFLRKFLTAPYCMLEMTTYTGNPVMIRPEMVYSDTLTVTQWSHVVPPNPRLMYSLKGHNGFPGAATYNTDYPENAENLDALTGFSSFPTFSVLNNSSLMYLAQNAHSIPYQYSSAAWNQQKALRSADTAYSQATKSIAASNQMSENSIWGTSARANQAVRYNNLNAGLNTVTQGLGAAGSLAGLDIGGAARSAASMATSGLSAMIQNSQTQAAAHLQNQLTAANQNVSADLARFNRDTNKELATFAANGDYENTVAGINAQVQDAQIVPPTTVGQTGGDAFALAVADWRIDIRVRMLPLSAIERIANYWLTFGYALNVWTDIKRLSLMTKFTYWKITNSYLKKADLPQVFRNTIRGIFEKGVTVWTSPDIVGLVSPEDNGVDWEHTVYIGDNE